MKRLCYILSIIMLLSCEVQFDRDLKNYIADVEGRTPIKLEVDGDKDLKINNEISLSYGYTSVASSKDLVFINKESNSIVLKQTKNFESMGLVVEGIPETTLNPGDKLILKSNFDVSVKPHSTVFVKVELESITGRPFVFNVWASSKMQPIEFNLNGNVIDKLDLGTNEYVQVILANKALEPVTVETLIIPEGFGVDLTFPLALNPIEERIMVIKKNNNQEQNGDFKFNTNFKLLKEANLMVMSGSILDVVVLYSNSQITNNGTLLLTSKNCEITIRNENVLTRDLTFSGEQNSFIWDVTNKILAQKEEVKINITVNKSDVFYITDKDSKRVFSFNFIVAN